jgi:hypothetical protein
VYLCDASAAALTIRQPGRKPMDASTFVRVVHIFHLCNGYSTIADVRFWAALDVVRS